MASLCRFASLSQMKVALLSALHTTTPIFAIVLGVIFLRRSVHRRDIIAILFCSSGAGFIAYDSVMGLSESVLPVTVVLTGLSAAALTAGAFVVYRKYSGSDCYSGDARTQHPFSFTLLPRGD
ncbi:EamA-like transporter [Gracilaria domingensis]|nr:EamA-like transporter [Gracilaria domingensis]